MQIKGDKCTEGGSRLECERDVLINKRPRHYFCYLDSSVYLQPVQYAGYLSRSQLRCAPAPQLYEHVSKNGFLNK